MGDDYDKDMQSKLAAYMADEGIEDEPDEVVDDDDDTHVDLDIPTSLPDKTLDHIILACSDLKEGMETFEDMTGIAPTKIGSLRGVGTKSARAALDKYTFVEIIGPDPKAESDGIAPKLLSMPKGELVPYQFVIRSDPEDVNVPEDKGWEKDAVVMIHADTHEYSKNGEVHKWDLVFVYGHGIGGCVPQFVNWRETRFHPTARLPKTSGKVAYVQVQAPEGHAIFDFLSHVNDITIYPGEPQLVFALETPKGSVKFTGSRPDGIVMPGFGDENHPTYSGQPM
eukprot:Nitzschia sp. Nitz4//scaffold56_size114212//10558//11403//NITZ4_003931-RA/size114212-processed-gene-0.51-mRNA-1//-1//CDS//3329554649//5887//frame0